MAAGRKEEEKEPKAPTDQQKNLFLCAKKPREPAITTTTAATSFLLPMLEGTESQAPEFGPSLCRKNAAFVHASADGQHATPRALSLQELWNMLAPCKIRRKSSSLCHLQRNQRLHGIVKLCCRAQPYSLVLNMGRQRRY